MFPRICVILLLGLTLLGGGVQRQSTPGGTFHDLLLIDHHSRSAYSPSDIASAYGFAPLYRQGISGTGETVALIEIDGYDVSDISTYDARYGLPAPNVTEYYVGGKRFSLQTGSETSFDLEWLHALAPNAAVQIYYVDNSQILQTGWKGMEDALQMAGSNGAQTISISLGSCWPGHSSVGADAMFASLFHKGISVFVSSGDNGDHCGSQLGVSYPAGDPYVVSVGGTSLRLRGNDTIAREVAWKKSGGGRETHLLRRRWQAAPTMPDGRQRWSPDVAFLGDPHTGVNYISHGQWMQAGGTSLGAPAWSAAWALISQSLSPPSQVPGTVLQPAARSIYSIGNSSQYRATFHDVRRGSNGRYRAGPGWDAVTGWGTPNVVNLAAAVSGLEMRR
ncbi:MAG: S53 family peptidase [Chloroflexota bacterium]